MSMLITNLYLKILLLKPNSITGQKMKFSIKNFFSKYDQTWRKLRIWSQLLKKSFRENFIFGAAHVTALKSFTKGIPYDFSCSAVQDVINKRQRLVSMWFMPRIHQMNVTSQTGIQKSANKQKLPPNTIRTASKTARCILAWRQREYLCVFQFQELGGWSMKRLILRD